MPTTPPHADDTSRRAIIWIRADQTDLARSVIEHARLTPAALGLTDDAPRTETRVLDVEVAADFRQALAGADADLLLMLGMGRTERETLTAPGGLPRPLLDASTPIFTLDPLCPSAGAAHRIGAGHPRFASRVRMAPLFRHAPGADAALEAIQQFGPIRTMNIACRCNPAQGSLAARLVDAMDLVWAILGEPESIDASVCAPSASAGLRLAAGESLADLTGDLSAHLRFADDRSAAISLSDRGGVWFRGATVLGPSGCLRFSDERMSWIDQAGETIDHSPGEDAPALDSRVNPAALIASRIDATVERRAGAQDPSLMSSALSLAEAALLSARTGQPESPATIKKMAGIS